MTQHKEDLEARQYAGVVSNQNLETEKIPQLFMGPRNNNLGKFIHTIWKWYKLVNNHDEARMVNLIYTIKNNIGPIRFFITNMTSFNEIVKHINIFYLSGNKDIKTLFSVDTLAVRSGLDTGACLKNMEILFQTTDL